MSKASLPAHPPPPFPPPHFIQAKRQSQGITVVVVVDHVASACLAESAPALQRHSSIMAGNVLIFDSSSAAATNANNCHETTRTTAAEQHAFMLQRKIGNAVHGCIRVAYVLKKAERNNVAVLNDDADDDSRRQQQQEGQNTSATVARSPPVSVNATSTWEIQPSLENHQEAAMVAIKIQDKSRVLEDNNQSCSSSSHDLEGGNPAVELAASQMIMASMHHHHHNDAVLGGSFTSNTSSTLEADTADVDAVQGVYLIAGADDHFVYTVMPYSNGGTRTLLDFCAERGRLRECEAKKYFRQILQGLKILQAVQICHRRLSLETVLVKGESCTIVNLGSALRIPVSEGVVHMIEPQPPCWNDPQYIAPELFREEPFDGYAVDLWSAGIILFNMLLGRDLLFAAPFPEDRMFKMICVQHKLREVVSRFCLSSERLKGETVVSEAAVDLLQRMLVVDARKRLTLAEIESHEWIRRHDDE